MGHTTTDKLVRIHTYLIDPMSDVHEPFSARGPTPTGEFPQYELSSTIECCSHFLSGRSSSQVSPTAWSVGHRRKASFSESFRPRHHRPLNVSGPVGQRFYGVSWHNPFFPFIGRSHYHHGGENNGRK